MVKGTFFNSTGNETGITVNGIVADVYGNEFEANHIPLSPGTNTITVIATDVAGYTATTSITVTAATGNYITLTSNIDSGIAPFETTLRVDGYGSGTTPSLAYTGPGLVDWTNCTNFDACKVKIAAEGVYYFTATGLGSDGNTYQDTIAVTVLSRTALDSLLQAKWSGMKAGMLANDLNSALSSFSEETIEIYRQHFTLLSDKLIQITQDMGSLNLVRIRGSFAVYDLRTIRSGEEYSYQVLFERDMNGIWKIYNF